MIARRGPPRLIVSDNGPDLGHARQLPAAWPISRLIHGRIFAVPPYRCRRRSCAGSAPPRLSPSQSFGRFPSDAMLRRSASMMLTTLLAGSGALFGLRTRLPFFFAAMICSS